jgi:small subunit ribosomal protein S3Ae
MAVGKNKKLGKKRKGNRKIVDPFVKKEWYQIKAPSLFVPRSEGGSSGNNMIGYTIATKSQGLKLAKDNLMGRVLEVSLGDLKPKGEEDAFRKFKLKVEDVQGMNVLTNFYGMDLTTDKLRSLVRKWHTLIEAHVDVKTTDGYLLRLFCIGFTKRVSNQARKTSYAQASQVRKIRRKMIEIMQREASAVDLAELVQRKLVTDSFQRVIGKAAEGVYPLNNVTIRKVKMLRAPKTDLTKLMELHGNGDNLANVVLDTGAKTDRPDEE